MQYTVRVKPGSRKGPLVETDAEGLIVYVRERAVDGAATAATLRALADALAVRPRFVTLVSGATSRDKVVEVADEVVDDVLRERLEALRRE